MKKLLSMLLALMLLAGSALAEATPVNTAITIDGVRVAFFDASGNYLQPMEKDGLLWVPLSALCENLGKTAQVQGQSVMVDGVRVGMFDEAGNFLMPQEVNGTVYVPVVAFCQSAGVSVEKTENGVAINREKEQEQPSQPESTPQPLYGYVPLTAANFLDFFTVETGTSYPDINAKLSPFKVTYKLTCRATTSYGLENVKFKVNKFGTVTMPSSGTVTKTVQDSIYRWDYKSDIDYIQGQGRFCTNAILQSFSLEGASGKLRMSYQEAENLLAQYYEKGVRCSLVGDFEGAVKWYGLVAQVDYLDSKELLKSARAEVKKEQDAEKAARAKAQEEANLKKYNEAQALLDEGKFNEAEKAFAELKNYKDSAAKVEEVKAARREAKYQQAAQALAEGCWQVAKDVFAELGDYKDSAAKLEEATSAWLEAEYQKGVQAQAEGSWSAAVYTFTPLGKYKDAAERLAACQNEVAYQAAQTLAAREDYAGAQKAFEALGDFKDSPEQAESQKLNAVLKKARELIAQRNIAQAKYELEPYVETSPEAKQLFWQAAFRGTGMETPMSSEGVGWVVNGNQRALMDYQGNVLAVVNHGFIGEWKDGYCQAGNPGVAWYQGGQVYYDAKGQRAFGQEFKKTEDFHQGKALVTKEDGTRAVINTQGEEIKLPEKKGREYVSYVGEDLVCFKEKDKYGLMNLSGKVVVKAKYVKAIGRFRYGLAEVAAGKTSVVKNGLINAKGKEVVKPGKYQQVKALGEDMIAVKATKQSTYWEILNLKGKPYTSGALPQCDEIERYGPLFIIEQRGDKPTLVRGADLKAYQVNGQAVPDADRGIDVGYQGRVFRLWNKDNISWWIDGEVVFKEDFTSKTPLWAPTMSFDSPYIVWINDDRGWIILDSEGNITF